MAQYRDKRGRYAKSPVVNDALSDFTAKMANGYGATGAYADGPFTQLYSKDSIDHAYKSSWVARAAVEMIPDDCFKKGYQWVAESGQIELIEAVEKRHKIKNKKKLAMTLARLDGESYVYFDIGDTPSKPLNLDSVRKDSLRFVNVLRMRDISKGPSINDPVSEFFGQPEYYEIRRNTGTPARIHPSRVIRLIGADDYDTGNGISVLSYMLQPIIGAETARDNVVALTTEASIDIISVCDLMDRVATPEGAAKVAQRYSAFRMGKATNKLGVLDKEGEEYIQHSRNFSTLPEVIETMRREAAASLKIPYALLFGRAEGLGTNGETDILNYYDSISTMQKNDIGPYFEPLDEVVIRSALGNRPKEIYLDWVSLWEMSDDDKSRVASQYATAAKTMVDSGIVPPDIMTEPLINTMAELGAFQGIDQSYNDWLAGGGVIGEVEEDMLNSNETEQEE